ncbi:MAG: hypothetical protein KBA31_08890 [Alphaproteobacteria bacterium]|nr:hypothetical protein [Alphaproteobacteria bacterium]
MWRALWVARYNPRMSQALPIALGALLLYFALRVVQMKRASLPFLLAYPLFIVVLLGGSVAVFLGASWAVVLLGLSKDMSLAVVGGVTVLSVIALWRLARRLIA